MKRNILFFALALIFLCSAAADRSASYREAMNAISAGAIQKHIRLLSHDSLQGRQPGTPGYEAAADYVAAEFSNMGLEPAGEGDSYFQEVKLARYRISDSESELTAIKSGKNVRLERDQDFFIYTLGDIERLRGQAQLVYGGYGQELPGHGYAPYEELSLKGKIPLVTSGTPQFAGPSGALEFDRQARLAHQKGAAGLLIALSPQTAERYAWARIRSFLTGGLEFYAEDTLQDFFIGFINTSAVSKLSDISYDSLVSQAERKDFKAFSLNAALKYQINASREQTVTASNNIIGKVRGSDPALRDEYVVYTAHLDHVGVGAPVDGDSIYNGAYDNATGCGIMLEIAKAFTRLDPAPKRSTLFIALTVEEIGLYGSRYFVNHPTVPIESIVANVNTDMILLEKPLESVTALGKEYADFENIVDESAGELDIELVPDPMPHERLFMRSDHFSFVQKGIPALFVINDYTDSVNMQWFKTHYHTPQDEYSPDMHFGAAASYARLNFLIGYRIAENPEPPKWRRDNVYGQTYGRE